jgi:hypothetical protein
MCSYMATTNDLFSTPYLHSYIIIGVCHITKEIKIITVMHFLRLKMCVPVRVGIVQRGIFLELENSVVRLVWLYI